MRRLPARKKLPEATTRRLAKETREIAAADDPKVEASRRYDTARTAKWFTQITKALADISGPGQRCMYCSGSEASQVEHYRPKSIFPELAMTWENYLWSCGLCNQFKGNRFPPRTEPGAQIVNPMEEDVWSFFFLDEFGNLCARWRTDIDDTDPRAEKTIAVLSLDRDALQETRQIRIDELRQKVRDAVSLFRNNHLSHEDLKARKEAWLKEPFQPDVADYFLAGPGGQEKPFSDFLALVPL